MYLDRLFKKGYPFLDWIQVDISSLCDSECIYCPHTEYRSNWQNRLLPMDLYEKIVPAFKRTKLVFLQGWGEPFTHPQFIDFLRLAKKAGCMTGTTTNGMMLDSEKIKELVDEGLDIICFSLAGIDQKNDAVRKGTRISRVLKCIEEIHRIRNSRSVDKPVIHIAYMLLRSGLDDLDKIPVFSENAGISQTVISSLSLLVNRAMVNESLAVSGEEECRELMNRFHEVKIDAERRDTDLFFNIVSPLMEESFCSENTGRALVVGSDGSISPCIMGCLPVKGNNLFYFGGTGQKIENISFGNMADETLNIIWNKKGYKRFVHNLDRGIAEGFCQNCMKRFPLDLQM
ncbi:radical SAM/SPASM domain-containing protein [Thermodesulfobacteriota bacterium]